MKQLGRGLLRLSCLLIPLSLVIAGIAYSPKIGFGLLVLLGILGFAYTVGEDL